MSARGLRAHAPLLALVLAARGAAAQEPARPARPEAFRYERPVSPGAAGPNRLAVDVPLLAGGAPFRVVPRGTGAPRATNLIAVGGLGDVRLYDAAGGEVPYLLIAPPAAEPPWLSSRVLAVASTKRTSGFEADFGRARAIDRVRASGIPAPFLKRVRLEGSGDRSHWTLLVAEGTLFDLPDEGLRQTELEFAPGEYRYLRLTWDDSSSARVPPPVAALARAVTSRAAPAPLTTPLAFERRASEPGTSRYRLRLPGARLPVTAIELAVRGGNVLRDARVSEGRLSGGEVVPVTLGAATLRRAVRGDLSAASLRIPIDAPSEAQLDLTIDDADNAPLEITGVSAVLAELPFIYFESERGDAIVARYGAAGVEAPRYDLEAARDSASARPAAEARWGTVRHRTPAAEQVAAGALPAAGAPIDASAFRYARAIPAGKPGLTALTLDAAALAHGRFADLRIAGPDGRQLPYLLEKMDEPLALDLGAPQRVDARGARRNGRAAGALSRYRIRLPYAGLPAARLVLATPARVFERRVRVEVERSARNRRPERWTESIAEATWSHADPDTPAPALTLALPPLGTDEAFLVVDEGDNDTLPLGRPRLLLPSYRLRFFREGAGKLALLYGRDDVAPPRYDIALLAPRLVGAPAAEVTPGPEAGGAPSATGALPMTLFWVVLAGAVAVLLLLIARLVRKSEETRAA